MERSAGSPGPPALSGGHRRRGSLEGALAGLSYRPGGVYEPDVAKCLREVTDHIAAVGVDLVGQEADVLKIRRFTFRSSFPPM